MWSIRNYFLHNSLDFRKFIHQIDFIMKPSSCIYNYDISPLSYCRLQCIKCHRSRITSHSLFYYRNPYSFTPNYQLIYRCRTKCICRSQYYFFTLRFELMSQLPYCSGLTYTIHSHHHNDIRPFCLINISCFRMWIL